MHKMCIVVYSFCCDRSVSWSPHRTPIFSFAIHFTTTVGTGMVFNLRGDRNFANFLITVFNENTRFTEKPCSLLIKQLEEHKDFQNQQNGFT